MEKCKSRKIKSKPALHKRKEYLQGSLLKAMSMGEEDRFAF